MSHMTNKMSNIDGWSSNAQEKDENFKLDDCVGLDNVFCLCPSCARHPQKMMPPETSPRERYGDQLPHLLHAHDVKISVHSVAGRTE